MENTMDFYGQLIQNTNVADAFFARVDAETPIVLFGAGFALKSILYRFEQNGFTNIFISDNNTAKHGQTHLGRTILSPDQAASLSGAVQFVVTSPSYFWEIKKQLEERFGAKAVCPVDFNCTHYFSGKEFEPYFRQNLEGFKVVESILADDLSRSTFRQVLKAHSTGKREDFEAIPRIDDDWYLFKSLLSPNAETVYVDCGAYDGDTISLFHSTARGHYKHIYAFEPDNNILPTLNHKIEEIGLDNITVIPKGVYDYNGNVGFTWDGVYSAVSESNSSVKDKSRDAGIPVVRMDDELPDVEVSIIKMDLEGAELNALAGAETIIRNRHPKLGICLYHNISDILKIPEFIHQLDPTYKIHIRHHSTSCNDTIMYAI